MAEFKYTFTEVQSEDITKKDSLTLADENLINSSTVNSSFNKLTDFIELHYYSLDNRWLKEVPNNTNYSTNQDSGTANSGTLDSVKLNLEADLLVGGYESGEVYLSYNFLTDYFTDNNERAKFFIEEISSDRFELRLLTTELDSDFINTKARELKNLLSTPETSDFYLNFGKNRLLLAVNIDTLPYNQYTSVVIRLYNPLPAEIGLKDTLNINLKKADSISYYSQAEVIEQSPKKQYLKGPNFNINQVEETTNPTQYLNLQESFNYPVTNSYYEVQSILGEKSAELSIDYSDYNNFINFSSAKERLENFQYKLNLVTSYQSASNARLNTTTSDEIASSSLEYYEELINNIIGNFDHYDRFLYYETGSFSWPKEGISKPYTPLTGSATGSWYTAQLNSASVYDDTNPNQLYNTIPEYLREDPNNAKYGTFIHMIGQHFDNLWIYSKAVTDKYDADNRLDKGVSKDLIEDALKNFGVKLYSSNRSTQDLFKMFTGETYDTGSEGNSSTLQIQVISGSDQNISEENYRKQVYKRIYHNLPLLLKTKGTERGIRALLSSFGAPSFYSSGSQSNTGSLFVSQLGGTISGSYFLGEQEYVTSSLDKIRIDNTGSIIDNTLSRYVSINKRDKKYTDDLNNLEIGYSPTTYINNIIIESARSNNFDLGSILGDPRNAYSSSYSGLEDTAKTYLQSVSSQYDLKDFTRLLKYYDNVLFKTVKDFVPARSNASTGIIIKPHLLERPKTKQVELKGKEYEHLTGSYDITTTKDLSRVKKHFIGDISITGSINIGIRSGSHADTFGARDTYTTNYTASIPNPLLTTDASLLTINSHNHEEAKYDGEFSGSYLKISDGELNRANSYKKTNSVESLFYGGIIRFDDAAPSPSPTPSFTPTPTISPSVTPTPTPTPSTQYGSFILNPGWGLSFSNLTSDNGTIPFTFESPVTSLQTLPMASGFANDTLFTITIGSYISQTGIQVNAYSNTVLVGSTSTITGNGNYTIELDPLITLPITRFDDLEFRIVNP